MEASRRNFLRGVVALGFTAVVAPKFPTLRSDVLVLRGGESVVGQTFVWPQRIIMLGNDCLVDRCNFAGLPQDEMECFVSFGAEPAEALATKSFIVAPRGVSGCMIRDGNFAGSIAQLKGMQMPSYESRASIGFLSVRSA